MDQDQWPQMRELVSRRFKERSRSEWAEVFHGTDACVTPVLELDEMESEGYEQRPAFHLSGTPARSDSFGWRSEGLEVNDGGKDRLREWMGWKEGQDFEVLHGTFFKKAKAKF